MRVLLVMLALWSCSFWGIGTASVVDDDLEAKRAQVVAEFTAWLAKPDVLKAAQAKNLAGAYTYTVVVDYNGNVQTVYADDNLDALVIARQNEMTRLIRTFRSSVRLKRDQRIKFSHTFTL